MEKRHYLTPQVQIIELSEQVGTAELTTTSDPNKDGTSVLVSWLIG